METSFVAKKFLGTCNGEDLSVYAAGKTKPNLAIF